MTPEMQRALHADGKKLRQLTGEDHGPWDLPEPPQQWFVCDECDGTGEIPYRYWGYEHGCGHGHWMDDAKPCGRCGGDGGWLDDATAQNGTMR